MANSEAKDESKKGQKLFSDISVVQVVSTALAAVTSMFLASYIGIAGSLIGAGIASVISTIAASLYKKVLADSTRKIKELPETVSQNSPLANILPDKLIGKGGEGAQSGDANDSQETSADHIEPTSVVLDSEDAKSIAMNAQAIALASSDGVAPCEITMAFNDEAEGNGEATQGEQGQSEQAQVDASEGELASDFEKSASAEGTTPSAVDTPDDTDNLDNPDDPDNPDDTDNLGTSSDASEPSAAASVDENAAHQRRVKRNLIIVCVVSALLAVAASAGVIYFVTTGQGIGAKPEPITMVLQKPSTEVGNVSGLDASGEDGASDSSNDSSDSSSGSESQNSADGNQNAASNGENTANATNGTATNATAGTSANSSSNTGGGGSNTSANTSNNSETNTTSNASSSATGDTIANTKSGSAS